MADSVTPGNLPAGFDLYAGYDDGRYMDAAAIAAEYPDKPVVKVTVFAADNEGDCLDIENMDATAAEAPGWVQRRRAAGADPSVYCSESAWAAVRQAFHAVGVPEPHYWIAGYPGSVGEALYPGSVAHQWIDRGPYDESVVADYWPGVDPAPIQDKESEMQAVVVTEAGVQKVLIYAADPHGHLLEFVRVPGQQTNDVRDITAEIGPTANAGGPFLVQP